MPIGGNGNIWKRTGHGPRATRECCSLYVLSPTFQRLSSGCTNRFRCIPEASASSRAITSRARRTSGIPLRLGVGLFYGPGYFRQRLNGSGWQEEEYIRTDVNHFADGTCDPGIKRRQPGDGDD